MIYKPCGNRRDIGLPVLLRALQARRLPDRAGRAGRRQRRPRAGRRTTRRCSPPSPHRRSARSTPATSSGTPAPGGSDCDCRPEPCHARRDITVCPHGVRLVCFARHDRRPTAGSAPRCAWTATTTTPRPCGTCTAGELWRRTTIAINRYLHRLARQRGIPDVPVVTYDSTARSGPGGAAGPAVVRQGRRDATPRRRSTSTPSSASTAYDPDRPGRHRAAPARPRRRRPEGRRRPRRRHRRVHHRPAPGQPGRAGRSAGATRSSPR